MGETATLAFGVLAYGFMIYRVYKRGIKGIWKDAQWLIRRITYGPPEQKPLPAIRKPGSCMYMHLTAKAEIEVWGEIKSESVQDHMKICRIRIADLPSPNRQHSGSPIMQRHDIAHEHQWLMDGSCVLCYAKIGRYED